MDNTSLDIDALILVGGLGTRLRGVIPDDVPKPLAEIGGRPFLWYLLRFLAGQGVSRAVLATGYLADAFTRTLREITPPGMTVALCPEDRPLGTAGAIRHAAPLLASPRVLALNGDTFCPCDLRAAAACHRDTGAAVTDVLARVDDVSRYGQVALDGARITRFLEKQDSRGGGVVNAGIYLLEQAALAALPARVPCSFERDVLPGWTAQGRVYGCVTDAPFLDIGTPASYAAAEAFLAEWCHA